jgi:hypothetical protein
MKSWEKSALGAISLKFYKIILRNIDVKDFIANSDDSEYWQKMYDNYVAEWHEKCQEEKDYIISEIKRLDENY